MCWPRQYISNSAPLLRYKITNGAIHMSNQLCLHETLWFVELLSSIAYTNVYVKHNHHGPVLINRIAALCDKDYSYFVLTEAFAWKFNTIIFFGTWNLMNCQTTKLTKQPLARVVSKQVYTDIWNFLLLKGFGNPSWPNYCSIICIPIKPANCIQCIQLNS